MAPEPTAPPNTAPPSVYLIGAHPNWQQSRVNRRLFDAASALLQVQTLDLYGSYPDYHLDVPAEQARLASAQLLVLLHPVQWYSMPALLKLWLDEVLTYGWAYGEGGDALRGKDVWLVTTTGGPEDSYHPQSYNRYFFDAFLPPYEQTAALCGMRFLPPMVLHGAHDISNEAVTAHVETFRERLQSYPNWPEMDDIEACPLCEVPQSARPAVDAEEGSDAAAPGRPKQGTAPSGGSTVSAATSVGAS